MKATLIAFFILFFTTALALKRAARGQAHSEDLVTMTQIDSETKADSEIATEAATEVEVEAAASARLVLKRRQKYLYDYFFPKNMRDSIEVHKVAQSKNKTLA
mmetsp:Transcript_19565/g.30088  ORF Transcript_19565/g.30088 Transcript_19565/m.30088 type:complete len:103 (-) Transcript_19565:1352-1660(-)